MRTISVALATFQGERFLQAQLDSLASQSRLPDELVVQDDASTDDTVALLGEFAEQAPFPVSIEVSARNRGPTRAFEAALARCTGDVIALCDQDDVWRPDKLAVVGEAFEAPAPPRGFFSDADLVDEAGVLEGRTAFEWLGLVGDRRARFDADPLAELLVKAVAQGCTMAFDAELVRVALPFPDCLDDATQPLRHDRWLALVAAGLGDLAYREERLVAYRRHEDQVTRTPPTSGARVQGAARRLLAQFQAGNAARSRLVARHAQVEALLERLQGGGAAEAALATVRRAVAHLAARAQLDPHRPQRLKVITRQVREGGYRYSGGTSVAVADAVRALGPRRPS